jgi:hypothetical protein
VSKIATCIRDIQGRLLFTIPQDNSGRGIQGRLLFTIPQDNSGPPFSVVIFICALEMHQKAMEKKPRYWESIHKHILFLSIMMTNNPLPVLFRMVSAMSLTLAALKRRILLVPIVFSAVKAQSLTHAMIT